MTGHTEFSALPGPIHEVVIETVEVGPGETLDRYALPDFGNDWISVATFANLQLGIDLECNCCQKPGLLISLEHPKTDDGRWPILRDQDGKLHCPLCRGSMRLIYENSI